MGRSGLTRSMRQRRSGPGSPDHIRTSFPDQCLRRDQPQSRCLQSVHLTVQTNSMAAEKCCCESGRHYGWVSSRHSATKRSPVALRSRIGRCRSKFLPLLCDFKESHTLTAKAERGRQRRELAGPQRGFSRENSSWIEPRNFDFGRGRLRVRSASRRAHNRKRGDCVAWPPLPCFRLPIPPRPCCIDQA